MRRVRDRRIVRSISLLVALMGVVNVLSATTPALAYRIALLRPYLPLAARQGAHLVAVVSGFALLVLSQALWRRKRVAWGLTLAWLCISALSHLLKGLDYEEASLALALAVGLWSQRTHFQAHSDPPSFRQGLYTLATALVFTLAYGTLGFFLLERHYQVQYDLRAAVWQVIEYVCRAEQPRRDADDPVRAIFHRLDLCGGGRDHRLCAVDGVAPRAGAGCGERGGSSQGAGDCR